MIEVEVKLPAADLNLIKGKLLQAGFKETAFIEERDTYFDNQRGDISANGEALRVRETKDHLTGKRRAQINFKGKKLDSRTMTREELETGVENGAVCRKILKAIGYMPAEPGRAGSDQGQDNAAERVRNRMPGRCTRAGRISGTGDTG